MFYRFEYVAVAFASGCVTRVNLSSCASTVISAFACTYGVSSARVHRGFTANSAANRALGSRGKHLIRRLMRG